LRIRKVPQDTGDGEREEGLHVVDNTDDETRALSTLFCLHNTNVYPSITKVSVNNIKIKRGTYQ